MPKKSLRKIINLKNNKQESSHTDISIKNRLFYSSVHYDDISAGGDLVIEYEISTKDNVCFRDHIVDGKPCLPTDAYLELIYVACQSYLGFELISIDKMVMSTPVIADENDRAHIRLSLSAKDNLYHFKILSDYASNGRERLHARGVVSDLAAVSPNNESLMLTDSAIIHDFDVNHFYKKESSIHLGSFYKALQSLKFYNDHAIARTIFREPDERFSMNPSIISAALGSAISFSSQYIGESFYTGTHCFLPYRIDGLKLYQPLTENSYRVLIQGINQTKNAVECSLHIINEDNVTVFEIEHFRLQRIALKNKVEHSSVSSDEKKISSVKSYPECEEVAVIGVACRFPKSNDIVEFWNMLKNSLDCIEEVPEARWEKFGDWYNADPENKGTASSKYGGFIDAYDCFDPLFFNITPAEAELMDPQQRVFLEETWRAIENAAYAPSSLSNTKCGVYVGCAEGDYSHVLAKADQAWEAKSFPGTSSAILASRIAYLLNLKGPTMAIDTSCSSSLTAIHLASESIRRGENALAIAGGINIFSTPLKQILTSQIGMQSTDGRCHTFDQAANGTVFSEGCGVVLLKPLSKAIEDKDTIWGVIKASGINQDGKTNGITAPSALSQESLLTDIYRRYAINPADITYVEAHGTGTVLGDPIEIQGLKAAFDQFIDQKNYCAIGSLKSNMGHAVYAAGVAGFIKLLLCMKYKQLVPSINYNNTNQRINFDDSPFFVNKENKDWETPQGGKRLAAVSSFGFSGSNAHVVLEEYFSEAQESSSSDRAFIIPLSAKSVSSLYRNIANLKHFLTNKENLSEDINLDNIAYSLQVGRDSMKYRTAFVVESLSELIEKLSLSLNEGFQANANNGIFLGDLDDSQQIERVEKVAQVVIETWFNEGDAKSIAHYWVSGKAVMWQQLYREKTFKRIGLPTYAFEEERYWPEMTLSAEVKVKSSKVAAKKSSSDVLKPLNTNAPSEIINYQENIENDLMKLINEIFKVPLDRLKPNTNLIEFGFDSVSLLKYARTLSEFFSISMSPTKLFSNSTVRAIAEYLQIACTNDMQRFYGDAAYFDDTTTVDKSRNEADEETDVSLNEVRQHKAEKLNNEAIAIVGISGKFPKSETLDEYWENLLEGMDCISEIPAERWSWEDYYSNAPDNQNKTNIKWGGFIDEIQKFDSKFFGFSEKEAMMMDPQQRLLLKHAYKAIEDAGYDLSDFPDHSAGVFMGISNNGYENIVKNAGELLDGYFSTGTLPSVGPNRISYFFDLHGPSEPIETACASALVAIDRAINAIHQGICDTAIVGAVNVIVSPDGHIAFAKAGLLSPAGQCKPFSANADGFVRAEGVGVLVLKRLSTAENDHDHIYATIRGSGVNHNGRANFLTAPNPKAQADLLEGVYRKAGVDINTVTYIEAHGTGTELGDAVEVDGLKTAFAQLGYQDSEYNNRHACALGSVKSNIGHTEIASGMASIIKVLYQMKYKTLAKTIHCDTLNPYLQLEESPFYIVKDNQVWEAIKDENGAPLPRRAGVSAFGLSGVNSHIILEEYVDKRVEKNQTVRCISSPSHVFNEKNYWPGDNKVQLSLASNSRTLDVEQYAHNGADGIQTDKLFSKWYGEG